MNRIVAFIMCLTMGFAIVNGINPSHQYNYEIQENYENQGTIISFDVSPLAHLDSTMANIEIRYDTNVTPPKTYYLTVKINGVMYGGNLKLKSIRYRSDGNYALYSGSVDPME